MASIKMRVATSPTDQQSLTNRAYVHGGIFPAQIKHVEVVNSSNRKFVFTLGRDDKCNQGDICFSMPMRKWAELSTGSMIEVKPYQPDYNNQCISSITLEVDYMLKNTVTNDTYDVDEMAKEFVMQFADQMFTVGQQLGFRLEGKKILKLNVLEMKAVNISQMQGEASQANPENKPRVGLLSANSQAFFTEASESAIKLKGKAKVGQAQQSLFDPNWDFESMGIGGLNKEFNDIFRRAFASRVFSSELSEELGYKHVKGILLFGPPGTGKTLIARQIGTMLNARPPKIVNGPSILDKYVGESEANVRRLFEDAETEYHRLGDRSGLHMIIFDEIDAICKQRGSVAGASGVHDTVINQLLSKMDGVECLNNILVIGMTNRKDMIDEALLRPGRFEIQVEIGLPDEMGRLDILKIHTSKLRDHNRLAPDVDLVEIAAMTKNFTGAEIEGLIRAAFSYALNRLIKATNRVEVDPNAYDNLRINRSDFLHALEHDVKPAFGTSSEAIDQLIDRGIIYWCPDIEAILYQSQIFMQEARDAGYQKVTTILLEGQRNTGKSALAATIALNSGFPLIKLISAADMIGYSEAGKAQLIAKVFYDAYGSPQSCILINNIERVIEYSPLGPRYSNTLLQSLCALLGQKPPKSRSLLIICTTSKLGLLKDVDMLPFFHLVLHVPEMTRSDHLLNVINTLSNPSGGQSLLTSGDKMFLKERLDREYRICVGIKKFLKLFDTIKHYEPGERADNLLQLLERENCIYRL